MPRKETVSTVRSLRGVDLFKDPTEIDDNQFRLLRNCYPPRGSLRLLAKRLGSTKYNASVVASVQRFDNGIRAWKADGTKKLIVAANLAAADQIYVGNDAAGTFAAVTGPALGIGSKYSMINFPLLGACYIASSDGGISIQKSSDFAVRTDLATTPATDASKAQLLTKFRQRMVGAHTLTNPNVAWIWDAGSDTAVQNSSFARIDEPITACGRAAFGTSTQSLREMLVLAGAGSLWFMAGDPTVVAIENASSVIGCKSPKTMINTPIGLMFLGTDRNVYLIRSAPQEPEKVGLAIRPALLTIPDAQLQDAAAIYHDGFYKLTFSAAGGSTNTIQWWADLDPVLAGEPRIDWYGPMDTLVLSAFVLFDGPNDGLLLRGLDDAVGTAWNLAQAATWQDHLTTITSEITTKEYTEGDVLRQKIWPGFDFGYIREASGTLAVTANIDQGAASQSDTLPWTVSGDLWDGVNWDVGFWSGTRFAEDVLNWQQRLVGRTLQLTLLHNTNADFRLRDFTRKARIIPRMP